MPVTVVDASAVAAILFNEPEADWLEPRLAGQALVAPSLLGLEIMNIFATRVRRAPEQEAAVLGLVPVFDGLRIRQHAVEPESVLRLALASRLTAYDAAYLWLARHLGAPLITLDRALADAAIR